MNASDSQNLLLATSLLIDLISKAQPLLTAIQNAHAEGRGMTDEELLPFVADDDVERVKLQAKIDARAVATP